MSPKSVPSGRSVLVVGATGLVGSEVVRLLGADQTVARIVVLGRRAPEGLPAKAESHVVDFDRLSDHQSPFALDQIASALGPTTRKAGSQAAFRKVDFEYPLTVARIGRRTGVRHFLLVSAL